MPGTGETDSLLSVTTIHDTHSTFHILPFSPIFVQEQRRSSAGDKKWKQWDKTDEIWYEWMKWLFCLKYAKTDSFGDNRKARRRETKQVNICIRRPQLKIASASLTVSSKCTKCMKTRRKIRKNFVSLSIFEPNFFTRGNAAAADSRGDKNIFAQIWRD